jgi:hypothetical protein
MRPNANIRRLASQFATVTVTNSNVETSLVSPSLRGRMVLPGGFFAPLGKALRVRARGIVTSTGVRTLRVRLKLTDAGVPTTFLLDTGVMAGATLGVTSNYAWVLDADVACYAVGSGGSLQGQGMFQPQIQGSFGPAAGMYGMPNAAPVVMDLNGQVTIDLTAQWGAANAGESISCTDLTVEALN